MSDPKQQRNTSPEFLEFLRSQPRKLLSIQGFWRNDLPDGIHIDFTLPSDADDETCKELVQLMELIEDYSDEFGKNPLPVEQHLAFLSSHARGKPRGEMDTHIKVLATIHYLEKIHAIPCDEYNGVVFLFSDHEMALHRQH
jgi:hypothetical protein